VTEWQFHKLLPSTERTPGTRARTPPETTLQGTTSTGNVTRSIKIVNVWLYVRTLKLYLCVHSFIIKYCRQNSRNADKDASQDVWTGYYEHRYYITWNITICKCDFVLEHFSHVFLCIASFIIKYCRKNSSQAGKDASQDYRAGYTQHG